MSETNQGRIGPHEGQELELMLSGSKHLSVFCVECHDEDWYEFPEPEFDQYVSENRLVKHEQRKLVNSPRGGRLEIRTVIYATLEQRWRIEAYLFIDSLYLTLGGGFRPDFERIIGNLLGYEHQDIERYINNFPKK